MPSHSDALSRLIRDEAYEAICNVQVFDKDEDVDKKATLKLARDTKNPTAFEKERNLGTYRTTQSMAFAPPPEVCHAVERLQFRALFLICLICGCGKQAHRPAVPGCSYKKDMIV